MNIHPLTQCSPTHLISLQLLLTTSPFHAVKLNKQDWELNIVNFVRKKIILKIMFCTFASYHYIQLELFQSRNQLVVKL